MAVRPAEGRDAWFSGIGDASSATLTTRPLTTRGGPVKVSFDTFVDTEGPSDPLVLEASSDGVTWTPVSLRASGPGAPSDSVTSLSGHGHRAWWRVSGEVTGAAQTTLRWRYGTDARYTGRGVSVDSVKVTERGRILLDGERQVSDFSASGWQLNNR
jgi:hypothetical protein